MAKEVIIAADLGGVALTSEELAAIPDFKGIRKETWDKFPGAVARKEYAAGEILMRQGESGTTAFYLVSGSVDIFIEGSTARVSAKKAAAKSGFFSSISRITDYMKGTPVRASRHAPASHTHVPV